MSNSLQKAFLGLIALGVTCIAIELVPVSKKAAYWNTCFDSTVKWMNKASKLHELEKKAKESFAVAVCNGAVHEPNLKDK